MKRKSGSVLELATRFDKWIEKRKSKNLEVKELVDAVAYLKEYYRILKDDEELYEEYEKKQLEEYEKKRNADEAFNDDDLNVFGLKR